jgi:hypothetical protein
MKKWALGLVLIAASVAPAFAALGGHSDVEIRVYGEIYRGNWDYVGDRIYVNVDAPHIHDALNWQLVKGGKGNPYQLSVDANKSKLPTIRHGGITMVDLEKACDVLKVPYHKDYATGTVDVGSPWAKEYVIGSYYRHTMHSEGKPYGSTRQVGYEEDQSSWSKTHWNTDHHEEVNPTRETHEHYFRNF